MSSPDFFSGSVPWVARGCGPLCSSLAGTIGFTSWNPSRRFQVFTGFKLSAAFSKAGFGFMPIRKYGGFCARRLPRASSTRAGPGFANRVRKPQSAGDHGFAMSCLGDPQSRVIRTPLPGAEGYPPEKTHPRGAAFKVSEGYIHNRMCKILYLNTYPKRIFSGAVLLWPYAGLVAQRALDQWNVNWRLAKSSEFLTELKGQAIRDSAGTGLKAHPTKRHKKERCWGREVFCQNGK